MTINKPVVIDVVLCLGVALLFHQIINVHKMWWLLLLAVPLAAFILFSDTRKLFKKHQH